MRDLVLSRRLPVAVLVIDVLAVLLPRSYAPQRGVIGNMFDGYLDLGGLQEWKS